MIMPLLSIHSLLFLLLTSCSPGSETLAQAQQSEQDGDLVRAFELYTEVINTFPASESAETSDQALQRIYSNYAEQLEDDNSIRAINIYEVILRRWPESQVAVHAKTQLEDLNAIEEEKALAVEEDKNACEAAQVENTMDAWQLYIQNFPEGQCIVMAKQRLSRRAMDKTEQTTVQTFISQCKTIKEKCSGLETRYRSVVAKKKLDYVDRVLVPYAKREQGKAIAILQRAEAYLDELNTNNIDTEDQLSAVTDMCNVCEDVKPIGD